MCYVKMPIYAINVSIIIAFRGHRKSNLEILHEIALKSKHVITQGKLR